jgi:hypothetical protein
VKFEHLDQLRQRFKSLAKVGRNRAHVDMFVDDLDQGTARVEELGGRWTQPGSTVDDGG